MPNLCNRASIEFCPFFATISGASENYGSSSGNTVESVISNKDIIDNNTILYQFMSEIEVASLEAFCNCGSNNASRFNKNCLTIHNAAGRVTTASRQIPFFTILLIRYRQIPLSFKY